MKRAGRLQSAKKWLDSFEGKNVVRGYAKWFGVDLLCAAKELQLLGVKVDPAYLENLEVAFKHRRPKRQPQPDHLVEDVGIESDENFFCIAGYTSGGVPFGVPWDDSEDVQSQSAEDKGF